MNKLILCLFIFCIYSISYAIDLDINPSGILNNVEKKIEEKTGKDINTNMNIEVDEKGINKNFEINGDNFYINKNKWNKKPRTGVNIFGVEIELNN